MKLTNDSGFEAILYFLIVFFITILTAYILH